MTHEVMTYGRNRFQDEKAEHDEDTPNILAPIRIWITWHFSGLHICQRIKTHDEKFCDEGFPVKSNAPRDHPRKQARPKLANNM